MCSTGTGQNATVATEGVEVWAESALRQPCKRKSRKQQRIMRLQEDEKQLRFALRRPVEAEVGVGVIVSSDKGGVCLSLFHFVCRAKQGEPGKEDSHMC